MTRYELDGRAAIVTGAGAGIGEASARTLAFSGASVLVVLEEGEEGGGAFACDGDEQAAGRLRVEEEGSEFFADK